MKIFDEYKGLRKELYVLCIGGLVTSLGAMVWPMLTLILNQKFDMNASQIASYFIMVNMLSIPVSLLGGKLADSCNKKKIIIFCDSFSIICYLAAGLIPLSKFSIVLMVVASIFQRAESPAYQTMIIDFATSKDRERAFSLSYLANNLGLILSPIIGGYLFNKNISLLFIINGISIGCSTAMIFFMIHDMNKEDTSDNHYENEVEDVSAIKYVFSNRILALYCIIVMLGSLVYAQFNALMPLDLARIFGDNGAILFGSVTSLNCVIVVCFTAPITRWFKSVIDINKMLIGESLILSGFVVFVLLMNFKIGGYICITIFTLGEIFNTLSSTPYLTRRIPANYRGRVTSLVDVMCAVFASLAQKPVSYMWDKDPIKGWLVVFGVGAVMILLLMITRKLDKKDYRDLYDNGGTL